MDEPAEFSANGTLLYTVNNGIAQEGWVEVEPYWAPGTTLKVCGFDAQDALYSIEGTPCSSRQASSENTCGCGPNLRYCRPTQNVARNRTAASFGESVDRFVRDMTVQGHSYLHLFQAEEMWVNGPIIHYLKHMVDLGGGVRMTPSPISPETLPDIPFHEADTWVLVPLDPAHAGVLTHPAYLLRFQTNRGRADRFYTNFLCQPFQPPEEGLPVADEEDALNPDLQNRPGCEYCHGLLEPAASYWGRWTETGGGFLDPDAFFSAFNPDCEACATTNLPCSADCSNHYVVNASHPAEEPFLGWLKSYVFRQPAHYDHIEQGPELLVMKSIAAGHNPLARCTARKLAEDLLGRPVTPLEEEWIETLGEEFVAESFDYRTLVRSILTSDAYRRVR